MHLIWFRNDIRIDDNPALQHAIDQAIADNQPLSAIFIAPVEQWQRHHRASIQIDLLMRHLDALASTLHKHGIDFHFFETSDFKAQQQQLESFCQQHKVTSIWLNQELELNEQLRDQALQQSMQQQGIHWHSFEIDTILPKGSVLTGDGQMYRVFSPFKRAWLRQLESIQWQPFNSREALKKWHQHTDSQNEFVPSETQQEITLSQSTTDSSEWPLISEQLEQFRHDFLNHKLEDYAHDRDYPAIEGTSRLSPYLAIGCLSPKRLLSELLFHHPFLPQQEKTPLFSWLNELIWREFYRHLLHFYPNLIKGQNFNAKYDVLPWNNNPFYLKAWQEAKTGYPIVDAAMRQLQQTGWMHNRLRMIVASFFTKHLLLDWRLGEIYFAKHLIDFDFASNNGGWQWSSSTGCDAQPYFRIFNPISQSQKFDPDGNFIRKYVPELKDIPTKELHFPHKYIAKMNLKVYWPAIVDHKEAREKALNFYQVT